jgi:hypothetical protein
VVLLVLAGCAATSPSTPRATTSSSSSPHATATPSCLDSPEIAGLIRKGNSKSDDFNTMVAGTLEDLSSRAADATAGFPAVAAAFTDAARAYGKGDAAWRGRYWEKDLFQAREMLANGSASFAQAVDLCTHV